MHVFQDKEYKMPKSKSIFDKVVTYDKPQTVAGNHDGWKVTSFRIWGYIYYQTVESHSF